MYIRVSIVGVNVCLFGLIIHLVTTSVQSSLFYLLWVSSFFYSDGVVFFFPFFYIFFLIKKCLSMPLMYVWLYGVLSVSHLDFDLLRVSSKRVFLVRSEFCLNFSFLFSTLPSLLAAPLLPSESFSLDSLMVLLLLFLLFVIVLFCRVHKFTFCFSLLSVYRTANNWCMHQVFHHFCLDQRNNRNTKGTKIFKKSTNK